MSMTTFPSILSFFCAVIVVEFYEFFFYAMQEYKKNKGKIFQWGKKMKALRKKSFVLIGK